MTKSERVPLTEAEVLAAKVARITIEEAQAIKDEEEANPDANATRLAQQGDLTSEVTYRPKRPHIR